MSRISLTEANDPRKLAYETYRINRNEYLILCKYLSPWFIGEQPEDLANKLFDVRQICKIFFCFILFLNSYFVWIQHQIKLILFILFDYRIFYGMEILKIN